MSAESLEGGFAERAETYREVRGRLEDAWKAASALSESDLVEARLA